MKRAPSFAAKVAVAAAALIASHGAIAAGSLSASDAATKKTTNSFNVLAPAAQPTVAMPSNGTGVAPAKAIVTNPYAVPMFQNAGSLRPGR